MLLLITRELSHGALQSSNENKDIILTYMGGPNIACDRRLKIEDGLVPGIELIPITSMANIAHWGKTISVNAVHKQVDHPSFAVTKFTATSGGMKLQGNIVPCRYCAIAKARKKNVTKIATTMKGIKPSQWISLDISSPTTKSVGGNTIG